MAWVEELPGGGFRGCYRTSEGRKRSSTKDDTGTPFLRKTAAQRWAAEQEGVARRTRRDLTAGRMKWGAWCDEWLPTRRIEASTTRASGPILKNVRDRWDHVPLDEITPMPLRRWVRDLEQRYAPSSIEKHFYLLSASLKAAQQERLIDYNPCRGIDLPPLPPPEERFLTDVEVSRIMYHLDGPYRMLGEVLIGTGMRLSEAIGLHWHRVDLSRGTVDVIETWDEDDSAMKAYPKGRRRRTVPMTPELVDALVRWSDMHGGAEGTCGRPHAKYAAARRRAEAGGVEAADRCRSALVIPGVKGGVLDKHNFGKRHWGRAVELAEVAGATPHALRHTYASRLVTAGVSLVRLQKLLGHMSIVTTERYAHLMDDGHDEVRAALAGGAGRGADHGTAVSGVGSSWSRPRAL